MVITYFGHEFFKVQFGDITLAFNPISKDSKLKTSRFGADIALISMNNKDMNGEEQISFGEKKAFVIKGPGEYEVKEVFVKGFLSNGKNKDGLLNTIYTVNLEGMNICFLGALANKDLGSDVKEALGDIDILFVPIGGDNVLTPSEGYKLAVSLGARLIIPMHYLPAGSAQAGGEGKTGADNLKTFLKEGGKGNVMPEEKLTLKKKDLDGKEGEIAVLSSNA